MFIPYVKCISENFKQIWSQFNIGTTFKTKPSYELIHES
jgi:hypothetical protein